MQLQKYWNHMRIIFMGYHNIGYVCLQALIELCRELGDEIVAVVTHADDPQENIWFASVRQLAFENYLPVYQPANPNDPAFVAAMQALQPDFLFSCYYRHMLKQPLLDLPRLGALNLHGSLLPRYRGRCPVNWVLVHGETETGVTLHYMEAKADQGDIVAQQARPHHPGRYGLHPVCPNDPRPRDTCCGKPIRCCGPARPPGCPRTTPGPPISAAAGPKTARIDWRQPARHIYNLVRAVTHPYPGAFTFCRAGSSLSGTAGPWPPRLRPPAEPGQITAALPGEGLLVATGDGHFLITQAQWEGEPEFLGPVLATWEHLVGQKFS